MQKAWAFWRIPLPAGFLERGRHYQATTVTRALLVIHAESLGFLAHSITSRISRKVTGIAEELIT